MQKVLDFSKEKFMLVSLVMYVGVGGGLEHTDCTPDGLTAKIFNQCLSILYDTF